MFLITSRVIWWKSTTAFVVISPARTTRPVLHSVSAPTREYLSCASNASSTASEIWSETLSGWPSETDSDVNKKLDDMIFLVPIYAGFLARRLQRLPKRTRVQLRELRQGETVILGTPNANLDGAHEGCNAPGGFPV